MDAGLHYSATEEILMISRLILGYVFLHCSSYSCFQIPNLISFCAGVSRLDPSGIAHQVLEVTLAQIKMLTSPSDIVCLVHALSKSSFNVRAFHSHIQSRLAYSRSDRPNSHIPCQSPSLRTNSFRTSHRPSSASRSEHPATWSDYKYCIAV